MLVGSIPLKKLVRSSSSHPWSHFRKPGWRWPSGRHSRVLQNVFKCCGWGYEMHLGTPGHPRGRTRFGNLQGNLPTDLQHPLWSGYHTTREEDSKPRKSWGEWGAWALAVLHVYSKAWSHVCSSHHVWKSAHILATCMRLQQGCGLESRNPA